MMSDHRLRMIVVTAGVTLAVAISIWEAYAQAHGMKYNPEAGLGLVSLLIGVALKVGTKAISKTPDAKKIEKKDQ